MGHSDQSDRRTQAAQLLQTYTASFSDIPLAAGPDIVKYQNGSRSEQNGSRSEQPVFVIDVRDAAERNVSMIPGAVSKDEFEAICKSDPNKVARSTCIPYCTIGYRSGMYCRRLLQGQMLNGGVPAHILNGEGVVLWTHDVGSFEGGSRKVHCYGTEWDVAAEGFETVTYNCKEKVQNLPVFIASFCKYLSAVLHGKLCDRKRYTNPKYDGWKP